MLFVQELNMATVFSNKFKTSGSSVKTIEAIGLCVIEKLRVNS